MCVLCVAWQRAKRHCLDVRYNSTSLIRQAATVVFHKLHRFKAWCLLFTKYLRMLCRQCFFLLPPRTIFSPFLSSAVVTLTRFVRCMPSSNVTCLEIKKSFSTKPSCDHCCPSISPINSPCYIWCVLRSRREQTRKSRPIRTSYISLVRTVHQRKRTLLATTVVLDRRKPPNSTRYHCCFRPYTCLWRFSRSTYDVRITFEKGNTTLPCHTDCKCILYLEVVTCELEGNTSFYLRPP